MCGRFAITLPPEAVRAFFQYVEQPNFPPRTNIAPTQPIPIVRMERKPAGGSERHFVLVRWGFLPAFVKDPKEFPLVINARSETAATKPSFRNALKRRRCIIVADAFYEWQRDKEAKGKAKKASIPFLIRRRDGAPMALAGLWETWAGPNGEEMETACILTTEANALMAPIHDRMPVILEPEDFDTWLDLDEESAGAAQALMKPADDNLLEAFEISTAVNRVANDNEEIQKPAPGGLRYPTGDGHQAPAAATASAKRKKRANAEKSAQTKLFD
ncbi:MAG: SOS response-associated peptidase [Beijerinckiaceae bacterium]